MQCTREFYGKIVDFSMYMGKTIKYLFDMYYDYDSNIFDPNP